MPAHRIATRPPRGPVSADPIVSERADEVAARLEDAAHVPGGHAPGVAFPRSEADVARVLRVAGCVLPIGAQSSLTGGATPRGEVVVDTSRLSSILSIGRGDVRVQPGVTVAVLQEAIAAAGLFYPPVPTFTGAFAGGVAATNAAGPATFKYGSTRDWISALTVVLADGSVLDIERGHVLAEAGGWFEIERPDGAVRVPVPTYRMPAVAKCSAGYFAAPGMDLIDLFIGSEGTLGIVTEIAFRVLDRIPRVLMALVPAPSEAQAIDLVSRLRETSRATRRARDPRGLDVSAIEHMDRRALELVREDGADRRCGVTVPPGAALVLLVQLELPADLDDARTRDQLAGALERDAPDTPVTRFCRLLAETGMLDDTQVAVPGDRRRADQFLALREAVPAAVNRRVGLAQHRIDPAIEKVAADMIVPFDRFSDMMQAYRDGFTRRGLDYASWGHISDGNVHPNLIPRSMDDVVRGKEAILEFGREAARLGGCPLAEHGVGRSPVKQGLLRQLYGDEGIAQMRRVKRALDPEGRLAPGVIFPAREGTGSFSAAGS